jgi:hypothetical protein
MHKGSHTARAVKQTQTNVKTQSAGFYCWKMSSTLHIGVSEGFKLGTAAVRQEGPRGVTVTAGMRQRRDRNGLVVMVAILLLEFRVMVCLLRGPGLAAAAPPPQAREPPPDRTDPPPVPSKSLLSSSSSSEESTTHTPPS